jgi:LysM repeat protein/ABC-type branched-subunit amino acid transport system substrate-binding protein
MSHLVKLHKTVIFNGQFLIELLKIYNYRNMKITHYFLFLLFAGIFTCNLSAQQLKENEIIVIQGEKFVLHQVRTGETIFSISQRYMADPHDILKYNPHISEGIKIGEILKVPYTEGSNWQEVSVNKKGDPTHFEYFTISSRTETPYFIAREFGITVEEIYAYNPEVNRFKKGTKIRIPRWDAASSIAEEKVPKTETEEDRDESRIITHEVKPGETLYSISRRYNIPESEILFLNPGARKLKSGSIIYLPPGAGKVISESLEKEKKPVVEKTPEIFSESGAYFEHVIVSGETLWSLSRKYHVSEDELKSINPVLETGFPAGVSIKIPVKESDLSVAEPVNEDAFFRHQVQPGETLYRLSAEYGLTIPEIRKFNPQLANRNLVQGEMLLIPRETEESIVEKVETKVEEDSLQIEPPRFESSFYDIELPVVTPEECKPLISYSFQPAYNVALFLPLFVSENERLNKKFNREYVLKDSLQNESLRADDDAQVEIDEPEESLYEFYRESENFLEFYEGVLLAVDSLRNTGMRIRLNVFDTRQDPVSVRKSIYSDEFLQTDLIIGPVYPQVQKEVSSIASKNRIPMISPLSSQSDEINANPYYYQVNPTREFLHLKTAELIAEEYFNSNLVVVKTANSVKDAEEKIVDMVREKLSHSGYWGQPQGMQHQVYDFNREGPFGFNRVMSPDKENVILVTSLHEGDLSVILSNINNLVGRYSITLIGFNRYEQFHSITDEFFHNLKLKYVTPYWVDYSHPGTISFLNNFKKNFYTEPGNFGRQGYDVAFYFLSALRYYGKDFADCLSYHQVHLSQGNYNFVKTSRFGGYMNQGVSVVSYERNYEVVRKRIVGLPRFAEK